MYREVPIVITNTVLFITNTVLYYSQVTTFL